MKIAIAGLGLIGASLAKALRGKAEIIGIDADRKTVDQAVAEGVICSGGTDMSLVAGCEMAVIAVPVGSIVQLAGQAAEYLQDGAVLTDTGSTKANIVKSIDRFWPWFVGSHPIAGKENPGYASSQPDLFRSAMTIITPGGDTRQECVEKTSRLWESCGSRTCTMDPEQHDGLMAVISHMPHLLSYVSMGLAEEIMIHRELLGAGFRDFTRIAASDPVMWRDIFLENSGKILPLIDRYIAELSAMRSIIEKGRGSDLEKTLSAYARIRRGLYGDSR
jgi:prephenate dehydrogenase